MTNGSYLLRVFEGNSIDTTYMDEWSLPCEGDFERHRFLIFRYVHVCLNTSCTMKNRQQSLDRKPSKVMFAVHEKEIQQNRRVTIRYDQSSRTYFCSYHRKGETSAGLILSYDMDQDKWSVNTLEFKDVFETKLNDLFANEHIPFEEQLRYAISHLDAYFCKWIRGAIENVTFVIDLADQSAASAAKANPLHSRTPSFRWFRGMRDTRRWCSQDAIMKQPAVSARYSAPEQSAYMKFGEPIAAANDVAEPFGINEIYRRRTRTSVSAFDYGNEDGQAWISNKAPVISKIWLNVCVQGMDATQSGTGSYTNEETLKKLAEKFVIYFGGTFQCTVGHQYRLEYNDQLWHFIVLKYEFWNNPTTAGAKTPKTKIVFLINGTPYCVRG